MTEPVYSVIVSHDPSGPHDGPHYTVLGEVLDELKRQDKKWGVQYHDKHYWNTIITEELGESAEAILTLDILESYASAKAYVTELIHVAACAVQAIETLRRLHPEWDPEIELTRTRKGVSPRAATKGQIIDTRGIEGIEPPQRSVYDLERERNWAREEQQRKAGG